LLLTTISGWRVAIASRNAVKRAKNSSGRRRWWRLRSLSRAASSTTAAVPAAPGALIGVQAVRPV
jgi:hypothetical protein